MRLVVLSLLSLCCSHLAYADYFYHPFYQRSEQLPIISLTLDPQEALNGDLRIAAREGRIDRMEALIKKGAKVDGVSEEGASALMYASEVCNPKVGKFLLGQNAEVNLRDKRGKTALIYAAMASCSDMIRILTRYSGLDVRARDLEGRTALDYARDGASLYMQGPPVISVKLIKLALKASIHRHLKLKHLVISERKGVPKRSAL